MLRTSKRNQRFIKRFLFSYAIIIIFPLIVGIISYSESVKIITNDTKTSNILLMQQCMELLDSKLDEVDRITDQMSSNPKIVRFRYIDSLSDNSVYYDVLEAVSYLKPYSLNASLGTDYFIYFKKSNIVLDMNTSYSLEDFYKRVSYEGMDINTFYNHFLNKYHSSEFLPAAIINYIDSSDFSNKKHQYSVLTYLKTIPLSLTKYNDGTIIVLLKEDTILKVMSKIDISNGGSFYIADQYNNYLTGKSNDNEEITPFEIEFKGNSGFIEQTINGVKMYITYTISGYNNWRYVTAIPSEVVMSKANSIRSLILGITIVTVLLGIVISILLSYVNSKPILDIKKMLIKFLNNDSNTNKNSIPEFDFLKSSITNLIDKSNSLQTDNEKHGIQLRKYYFDKIIKGEFKSISMEKTVASQVLLEFNAKAYNYILISLGSADDIVKSRIIEELNAGKLINKYTNLMGYFDENDIKSNHIGLLLCFNTDNDNDCKTNTEKTVSWIRGYLYESYNIEASFAIGGTYRLLAEVGRSFNEANQVLEYLPVTGKSNIMWYNDMEIDNQCSYYYPIELEQRLLQLVKLGYSSDIKKLLQTLYNENVVNRKLVLKLQQQLRNEINGTIFKLNLSNTDDIIEKLGRCNDLNEVFECLQNTLNLICDEVRIAKNARSQKKINDILQYINDNYSNVSICLSDVATKFGTTEVYLSQLFKEQSGENFSVYIERIRIKRACELLSKSNMTIEEIAGQIGYNSAAAFRRAFKRVKNISPTLYRSI